MKSLKLYYCLFLFLPLNLLGQAKDSIISKQILSLEEVIAVPNKGFILFKTDNVEAPTVLDFSYFDLDNELISKISIPSARTDGFFTIEKIFIWNDNLVVCSSLYQPGFRKNHLLYYEYSLPTLTLTKSKILLKTVAPPDVYVPYFLNLSPDSSKLVALGWNYMLPEGKAEIQTKIFNKELTVENQLDYKFDYENKRIAIEAILIDDNSNLYITGNNYRGYLEAPTSATKIDHFVLGLSSNQDSKFWPIKKEKFYFTQIQYTLNKAQALVGSGYWGKGFKSGIGLVNISRDSPAANIITHQLDKEVFKAAYLKNPPTFNIPKVNFYDYELTHLICKQDAYFIIGERHKYDEQYDDIMVIKLTKKGELVWLTQVPKSQNTLYIPDKLVSFKLLEKEDKLYFLFNDNDSNYKSEKKSIIRTTAITNAKPALAELSLSTGILERKMLKNLLEKDYLFLPAFCQNTTKEDIIVVGTGVLTKAGKFLLKRVKLKAKQ